jgi:Na+/proline symporter
LDSWYILLIYFILAYIQGVIFVRVVDEKEHPNSLLILCILIAPVITFCFLFWGIFEFNNFLFRVGKDE